MKATGLWDWLCRVALLTVLLPVWNLEAQKGYQPNRHDLSEPLRQTIWSRWEAYFEAFGYDRVR